MTKNESWVLNNVLAPVKISALSRETLAKIMPVKFALSAEAAEYSKYRESVVREMYPAGLDIDANGVLNKDQHKALNEVVGGYGDQPSAVSTAVLTSDEFYALVGKNDLTAEQAEVLMRGLVVDAASEQ